MSYHYTLNLAHKNNLKKYILQKILLKNTTILIKVTSSTKHKNVFLNSPFHFKTVKSHLSIPTLHVTVSFPYTHNHQLFLGKLVAIETVTISQLKI